VKLIHTADVHLDVANASVGERAADHRQRIREAFTRIVDLCLERCAQVLVIAGDLFDSRTPSQHAMDFAFGQLARLGDAAPPIEVFLLPGTHDCWAEGTVFAGPRAQQLPPHCHVLASPEPMTVAVPALDLAVHGCAHRCDLAGQQPLSGMVSSSEASLNIGVAHGSHARENFTDDSSLFTSDQIAATGMDYLALGHWHTWHDHSSGGVTAINPGSPELLGFGERGLGVVALVTLGEGDVSVEPVTVGQLTAATLDLDVGELSGTEDLISRVGEQAEAETLLDVTLTGLAAPGEIIEVDRVPEAVGPAFFALRIRDESHPSLDGLSEIDMPEALAFGRFVQLARHRVESATNDRDRRVAERSLQLGVALLRGQEVL
jgi:DNA repair exonuclease SbcCD nuclease subunit